MHRWHIAFITIGLCISSAGFADRYTETRSNRQMAVTTCNDYRESNRLPCFVSRNKCPRGFEVIQRFSNTPGASFVACRDLRHERPAITNRATLTSTKKQELLQHFSQLVSQVQQRRIGEPLHLPKPTLDKLSSFFSHIQLDKVTIHRSEALEKGCFTDCQEIYCSSNERLDNWIDPKSTRIPSGLLHQLAHAERCEIKGGRERFLLAWLRHLPDELLTTLEQGKPIDANRIHFVMYMERHAKNRTESICRRIHCTNE